MLRRLNIHKQLLSALHNIEPIERPRRRSGDVQACLVIDALVTGTDKLLPFLVPGHQTAKVRAAPGECHNCVIGSQDENFMTAEVQWHRLTYRNLGFRADQDRLRLPLSVRRHKELAEANTEGPDPEQQPKSHD